MPVHVVLYRLTNSYHKRRTIILCRGKSFFVKINHMYMDGPVKSTERGQKGTNKENDLYIYLFLIGEQTTSQLLYICCLTELYAIHVEYSS